jgi:hypothetical protein
MSANGLRGYAPNPSTVVFGPKSVVERLFAGGDAKPLLAERLRNADPDNDVILVVSPDSAKDLNAVIAGMQLAPLANLVKAMRGGEAALNLKADSLLRLHLEAKDKPAADRIEEMLNDNVKVARAQLAMMSVSMPPEMKRGVEDAFKLVDELLDGIRLAKSGNEVTAVLARPTDLDQRLDPILEQVKKFLRGGRQP